MRIGGIMVIPVGGEEGQKMTRIIRIAENEFERSFHGDFAFVPMLKDKSR